MVSRLSHLYNGNPYTGKTSVFTLNQPPDYNEVIKVIISSTYFGSGGFSWVSVSWVILRLGRTHSELPSEVVCEATSLSLSESLSKSTVLLAVSPLTGGHRNGSLWLTMGEVCTTSSFTVTWVWSSPSVLVVSVATGSVTITVGWTEGGEVERQDEGSSVDVLPGMEGNILMAQSKTAVTPVLMHWSYCSLPLGHPYDLAGQVYKVAMVDNYRHMTCTLLCFLWSGTSWSTHVWPKYYRFYLR